MDITEKIKRMKLNFQKAKLLGKLEGAWQVYTRLKEKGQLKEQDLMRVFGVLGEIIKEVEEWKI